MKTKLRRNQWNTYRTTGYTHDVANDPRSQGGVHQYQVRKTKSGLWQKRIYQSQRALRRCRAGRTHPARPKARPTLPPQSRSRP